MTPEMIDQARAFLRDLHERELAGLEVFAAAVARAQGVPVLLPMPPAPVVMVKPRMPVQADFERVAKRGRGRPRKAKEPRVKVKVARAKSGGAPLGPLPLALMDAVWKCGAEFTAGQLLEKLSDTYNKASANVTVRTLRNRGFFKEVAKGKAGRAAVYVRGPKFPEPKPMGGQVAPPPGLSARTRKEEAPEPKPPRPPRKQGEGFGHFRSGQKMGAFAAAVMELFAREPGPLPVNQVVEECCKAHPELLARREWEPTLRATLIDLANSGNIVRLGHGAGCHYRANIAAPDAEAEAAAAAAGEHNGE